MLVLFLVNSQAWVPLETHGVDSPITEEIRHVLAANKANEIPFTMPMYVKIQAECFVQQVYEFTIG